MYAIQLCTNHCRAPKLDKVFCSTFLVMLGRIKFSIVFSKIHFFNVETWKTYIWLQSLLTICKILLKYFFFLILYFWKSFDQFSVVQKFLNASHLLSPFKNYQKNCNVFRSLHIVLNFSISFHFIYQSFIYVNVICKYSIQNIA